MMLILLAAAVAGQGEFFKNMNQYLTCLSAGVSADLGRRDLDTRKRLYRNAAARCQSQRQAAIDAAIREREPGLSQAQAQALAIDIVDTLDPMSSMRKR